jgi:F-type H+-transporting ATPase subunit a
MTFFLSFIIQGILNNRSNIVFLFYPKNVPLFLLFFLILVELLSFFIRPFSLGIRLFANMLAGHTLLNIFGTFAFFVSKNYIQFLFFPVLFCLLITILEIGVSVIQAYVFIILLIIYIVDITKIKH